MALAAVCQQASICWLGQARARTLVQVGKRAMDYGQIDVLDKGTVWQGGALDAAIDSPRSPVPFWWSVWIVVRTRPVH